MANQELLREISFLARRKFVVISHRQPFSHVRRTVRGESAPQVRVEKPASGLTLALEPILQAAHGTWIAAASGNADADFVDAKGVVAPTREIHYRLRRLFLPPRLREEFYTGFSNSSLWPLCHIAYHQPRFEDRWWKAYQAVNRLFCDAVADELRGEPAVLFIQDFHLALLPQMARERIPQALIAQFWHIPWPNPEVFRICPWRRELLAGLLGNDLLGFHLAYHRANFLETLDREMAVQINRESNWVISEGHRTAVAAFPISVDTSRIRHHAATTGRRDAEALRNRYGRGRRLALSVERMDYSKGIIERLEAIQRLFLRHPELRGQVSFVQISTPSRTDVRAYRDYADRVDAIVREINHAWGVWGWTPMTALHTYVEPERVWSWYFASDLLIVSSLHDGMNLVAKEFAAAAREDAVLLLSQFTGAARELREAVLFNPYATDAFAEAIAGALALPEAERRERMRRLRWRVSHYDITDWAGDILRSMRQHEFDAQHTLLMEPRRQAAARLEPEAAARPPRARRQRL